MHKTWVYLIGDGFGAKCKCSKRSGKVEHRWQAEDWERGHLDEVNRIQARHANRSPSLSVTLKQYRQAQANPECTTEQQELWKQMADEVQRRIDTSGDEQLPLW